ncbi:MAG: hypothetical protein ACP5IZ_10440 [Thermoprotei archaeon]
MKALRENQEKLWRNQEKLLEEVKNLREGQNRLWEEVKSLREGQNKLWEGVKSLSEGQNKLWRNFRELGRAVGMTLDHYTAAFLEEYLEERGYPEEKIRISVNTKFMIDDRENEANIFNRDPLIVSKVTTYIRDENEAKNEVENLLKKERSHRNAL